jgi:hypothetical protein
MHDPYLVQRLVLSTYKAKRPNELAALRKAARLLTSLDPKYSNDPETLGLAGAIEKRFFALGQGDDHLRRAIRHYQRGFFLRNDWYNGINWAYLLTVRSDTPLDKAKEDKIADLVWANRVWRGVLDLCDRDLEEIRTRQKRKPNPAGQDQLARDAEQEFWCLATKAEAHFGLGQFSEYERTRAEARGVRHAGWMLDTFDTQIRRLRDLLAKHGQLLNPPWREGAPASVRSAPGKSRPAVGAR